MRSAVCALSVAPLFLALLRHFRTRFKASSQNYEKRVLASPCLSVRPPSQNNSAPTGRIFKKFDIRIFFENLPRKFKFHCNLTRATGTVHADRQMCTVVITSRSVLVTVRNVSDKTCTENQNTHFVFSNIFSKIVPFMR